MITKKDLLFGVMLVVVAVATRLIPHWPNFTAVIAVSVLAGSFQSSRSELWKSVLIPTLAMLISDLILGFHPTQLFVYLPIWATVILAHFVSNKPGFLKNYNISNSSIYTKSVSHKNGIQNRIGKMFEEAGSKLSFLSRGLFSALVGGLLFFVVSNLGIWILGSYYEKSWEGLIACFVAALPFYGYQIAGDVVYTTLGISIIMEVRNKIAEAESQRSWARLSFFKF